MMAITWKIILLLPNGLSLKKIRRVVLQFELTSIVEEVLVGRVKSDRVNVMWLCLEIDIERRTKMNANKP
jgi:hypothetical protein